MFGESIGFTIGGKAQHKTCFGAILSSLIYLLVFFYSSRRFNVMVDYGDTKHQTTVNEKSLDVSRVFTGEEVGLNMLMIA